MVQRLTRERFFEMNKAGKIRRVRVKLGRRSYWIHIGSLKRLAVELERATSGRGTLLITDANVEKSGVVEDVLEYLSSASELGLIVLKPGERTKTLGAVEDITSFAARHNYDRKSCFVALSGGVGGDLTGFAAGIYKRGIDFVQIPTTLLAMVDSSVGGKTGADLPEGKNLVGLFHQPSAVFIDPDFLRTLPACEWRNGLAEVIKYGVIRDGEFFEYLWANRKRLNRRGADTDLLGYIIERCVTIKAEVVAADECESGVRAILNYGHTFGHALEQLSGFKLAHGSAVAIGMALAGRLACDLGIFDCALAAKAEDLLKAAGLPVAIPAGYAAADIVEAMKGDKKNEGGHIRLVLPEALGRVRITSEVAEEQLLEFLKREV